MSLRLITLSKMMILIIGPRAAGKTSIGRALAQRLSAEFTDLDDLALATFPQQSVSEVWRIHGESAWRAAEAAAFERLVKKSNERIMRVIALGGGAPMIPAIREQVQLMRANHSAIVTYLRCSVQELSRRLEQIPGDRPSLTGKRVSDEVAAILADRQATYVALADIIVDTTAVSAEQAVEQLLQRCRPRPSEGSIP